MVHFDLIDTKTVLAAICGWKADRLRHYITLVNPHSVMLCKRDPEMNMAIQNAGLTLPDGIGIILGAKLLSMPHRGRIAGPEMMLKICDLGRKYQLRHYFYGGAEGVAEKLAASLGNQFPGLKVAGCYCPPFRALSQSEQDAEICMINAAQADIVWVGLGAPKQERWMMKHLGKIEATAMIGVGAAFDFHSGNKPWCPPAIRKVGFEWAYRLLCEPKRLWSRNIDSVRFLGMVSAQLAASAFKH